MGSVRGPVGAEITNMAQQSLRVVDSERIHPRDAAHKAVKRFRTLAEQENFPICNQHTEIGGSYLATDDVLRRSERDMPEEVRPRYKVNPEFFIKAVLVIALLSGLVLLVNSMR